MRNALQRRVPASLEFACNQPLGGINELIAAGGQRSLIPRFLKLAAERLPDLVIGLHRLISGLDGGVDRVLRNRLNDLLGDGAIDPHPADADAQPAADVTVVAAAVV